MLSELSSPLKGFVLQLSSQEQQKAKKVVARLSGLHDTFDGPLTDNLELLARGMLL